jgi:hypothetical protein
LSGSWYFISVSAPLETVGLRHSLDRQEQLCAYDGRPALQLIQAVAPPGTVGRQALRRTAARLARLATTRSLSSLPSTCLKPNLGSRPGNLLYVSRMRLLTPRRDLIPCHRRERPRPSWLYNNLEGAGGAVRPLRLRRKSLSLHDRYMKNETCLHTFIRCARPDIDLRCTAVNAQVIFDTLITNRLAPAKVRRRNLPSLFSSPKLHKRRFCCPYRYKKWGWKKLADSTPSPLPENGPAQSVIAVTRHRDLDYGQRRSRRGESYPRYLGTTPEPVAFFLQRDLKIEGEIVWAILTNIESWRGGLRAGPDLQSLILRPIQSISRRRYSSAV